MKFKLIKTIEKTLTSAAVAGAATLGAMQGLGLVIDPRLTAIVAATAGLVAALRNVYQNLNKLTGLHVDVAKGEKMDEIAKHPDRRSHPYFKGD